MSTIYTSLAEAAELELEGSAQRLMRAREALAAFHSQNVIVVCGAEGFRGDAALCESLERELHALLLEEDSAKRRYDACFAECLRHQKTPTPR